MYGVYAVVVIYGKLQIRKIIIRPFQLFETFHVELLNNTALITLMTKLIRAYNEQISYIELLFLMLHFN